MSYASAPPARAPRPADLVPAGDTGAPAPPDAIAADRAEGARTAGAADPSVADVPVAHEAVADTAMADAAPAPEPALTHAALRGALLDSRQRWRELVHLAADFAFETDAWGRFVFIAPDPALGWPAATLLGQPAELLLADAGGSACFNPFRPTATVRRRRAWLRRPDGASLCLNFSAAPLRDADGRIVGARGIGHDVSEQERRDAEVAGALRRGEVLDHILWRIRKEVLAPRMMQAALDALSHATGCEGVALVDMLSTESEPAVLHASGRRALGALQTALSLLGDKADDVSVGVSPDGRLVLACPTEAHLGVAAALVMWREPGARHWEAEERMLASATAAVLKVILEHDSIQREMVRQARTDPLTGLLNRRAFVDELTRRFDRLDVDGHPGALLFVDLDHFKTLNDARGHEAGDEALRLTAKLLQSHVRPFDLVARFGGDEFALWLDGADELSAAERAERLRLAGPAALAHLSPPPMAPITLSIGIAGRWPGRGETVDSLMERADRAMYAAKRSGRGAWRVASAKETP